MKDQIKLTPNQESFSQAYIFGKKPYDKSAAYREAYNVDNMSAKTIHRKAQDVFNNGNVTARINQLEGKVKVIAEKKFNITAESMLKHLDILRNSRIDEYVEFKDGKLSFKDFDKLTEEQLMCIESIKDGRNGIEIKLHGKDWTIEKINKHIGFYEKDNQQKSGELNSEERKKLLTDILEKVKR